MSKTKYLALIFSLIISVFPQVSFGQSDKAKKIDEFITPSKNKKGLAPQVDAYVKPYLDIGGFNGSLLIAKSGKVLLSKGYGSANYELNVPNAPQTKFHLASVSKHLLPLQ